MSLLANVSRTYLSRTPHSLTQQLVTGKMFKDFKTSNLFKQRAFCTQNDLQTEINHLRKEISQLEKRVTDLNNTVNCASDRLQTCAKKMDKEFDKENTNAKIILLIGGIFVGLSMF